MEENNMEQNNMEQNSTDQNNPGHSNMDQERKHLSEHFFHIGMLLHRYQTEAARENGPMGSPYKGQGRILAILKLKPEISHRELSYLLGISTQSMSELLRKLESKGYVKRVPSEQDRRSMNIILTEEGKRAVDQAGGFDEHDTERIFDCFSEEEKETFKQYLERLEQAIIGLLDPEHAEGYTFEKMKEMHDYILTRGPRERAHSHHHSRGMGPEGPHHGRRPEGPLHGDRPEGPFHGEGPEGPFRGMGAEGPLHGERPEGPFRGEENMGTFHGNFGRGPADDEEFRRRFGRRK